MDFNQLISKTGLSVLAGVPEGADALALIELVKAAPGKMLIHIARDDARALALREAIAFFDPGLRVMSLPAWDCLPYDRVSPNTEIVARRVSALFQLASEPPSGPFLLLTTMSAAIQRLPAREQVKAAGFRAAIGAPLDQEGLLGYLARSGYSRVGTVMEAGEFAVRGGLIDLFPPGMEEPIRLDLFGDTLESVRRFDPLSQRTTGKEQALALVPVSEVSLDAGSIGRFRAGYRELFGAMSGDDPLYAAVSEGRRQIGMEHWLPLFLEKMETVFDYLPGAPVCLDHGTDAGLNERWAAIADYFEARKAALSSGLAESGMPYKPLPPERLYLLEREWAQVLAKKASVQFSPYVETEGGKAVFDFGARTGRDFGPERAQGGNVYDAMRGHAEALRRTGKRIIIASFSAGSRERLGLVLGDHDITGLSSVETAAQLAGLPGGIIGLAVIPLERGFETETLALVSEQDLLGDRLVRPKRRARRAENFLAAASALEPGDLVVHIDHGIGRYDGLHTIDVAGAPHDCLLLIYDGGDRLYLPVENIELLSRYGSGESGTQLDKLGGASWQGRKARLKQRLKDMADELIRVAALRQVREADRLTAPEGMFDEFCARFPYEETEDQARAIEDTIADLSAGKPMDRLVCGDVGFGKTEVALRSAFVAALSGQQVAVVCPTTLLCRQHFRTFAARFHGLPVKVEQLSRMVPPKRAAEIKTELAEGRVDIVIGTHALLGKGVSFKNLGLLVIDEEQHFGVKHKERLKQLREDVHVLTLSATPIPRTLQLALSGVRELSLIATPPVDRLAVRTFVMPFDPVVVREALTRERARGGQSFYVCPRIEDLSEAEDFLRAHVPEVKVVTAHGRMTPSELEDRMGAFYEGRFDVLLSTSIVESGLDIPTANTMIVHRADMFGLAQLYQLRGRIGRSKLRAYAYFTLPAKKAPTANAERRLQVLQTLDTLGAGFSLASHDLDIRGAGNLLGEEQSGHIREVGFELYQELLEEAVRVARMGGDAAGAAASEKWVPQIALGTSVLIPEGYVSDLGVRLQLYRRVADVESPDEIESFAAEMIDRFGPLPDEVKHLLDVVTIKNFCRRAGIEKIDAGPKGLTISFRGNSFANPAGLVAMISRNGAQAKLRSDHKLVFLREWPTPEDRLKGVLTLVKNIASLAEGPAAVQAPVAVAPPAAASSSSRATRSKT